MPGRQARPARSAAAYLPPSAIGAGVTDDGAGQSEKKCEQVELLVEVNQTTKREVPRLTSDEAAEAFLDQDLSD